MAQPDREVRSLLEGRLKAMPSAPFIAWENRPGPTDTSQGWLRATLVFGEQVPESILGDGRHRVTDPGLFLVDCFAEEGKGAGRADELKRMVREWFPRGLALQGPTIAVRIEGNSAGQGQQAPQGQTGFFHPVAISWRVTYRVGPGA